MKAYPTIVVATALLAGAPALIAQQVLPDQLPAAVRRTLDRETLNESVKSITRQTINNRTIYLVEVEKRNAVNPQLRIAENGELLPPPDPMVTQGAALGPDPGMPVPPYEPAMLFSDLPDAVQQTVRKEARGREVSDIDRKTWQGRTVYEIEFRAEGRNPHINVAEDGTIVPTEEPRSGRLSDIFSGTQLADTPPAVQDTIRREAAGREINDIDVEKRSGTTVYEVEIRDEQAGVFQLHIGPEGQILKDSRAKVR